MVVGSGVEEDGVALKDAPLVAVGACVGASVAAGADVGACVGAELLLLCLELSAG